MSEDLKIQQGPSSTPYILGGGGLGAVAGLGATRYIDPVKNFVTEAPKYKSHEDLVNEAKDDFQKVIAEVESHEVDDKSFVDKLKAEKANIEKAKSEAEANWDKEFEKFKAKNAPKPAELPADHDLMKEQAKLTAKKTKAEENLKNKLAQLEKAEAERLQKEAAKQAKTPEDLKKGIDALTAQIDRAKANTKDAQTRLNTLVDELAGKLPAGQNATDSGKLDAAKKALREQIFGDGKKNKGIAGLSTEQKEKLFKEAFEETQLRAGLAEREAVYSVAKEEFENQLKAITDKALTGKKTVEEKIAAMKKLNADQKPKLGALQDLQAKRKAHIKEMWKKRREAIKASTEKIRHTYKPDNGIPSVGGTHIIEKPVDRSYYQRFTDTITDAEKKLMRQGKKGSMGGKHLTDKIQTMERNINERQIVIDLGEKLAKTEQAIKGGAKAKVELIVPENGNIGKWTRTLESFKNPKPVTTGDFTQQAKDIVAKNKDKFKAESDAVKAVTEKLDDVAKKIATEKQKLTPAIDEKAILKKYVETKGAKDAASKKAVGEATENALKGMTDDFTKWVKNATKTNTGKVAIAAVGAAVIGAVIGLMLKPSKKEA